MAFIDRRVGALDLRLKLQKKSNQRATLGAKGSLSGVRDLREKLSGITYSQPAVTVPAKPKLVAESSKPARRSIVAEVPAAETKKVASTVSKKRKVCYCLCLILMKNRLLLNIENTLFIFLLRRL